MGNPTTMAALSLLVVAMSAALLTALSIRVFTCPGLPAEARPHEAEATAALVTRSDCQAFVAMNRPWQALPSCASFWTKPISPPSACMSSVSKPILFSAS